MTPRGKELRFVDDHRDSPDPVLTHTFAQDGEYFIAVRDNMFRGRPEFTYRLTLGVVPYVTRYFPPGGKREAELKVQLSGVNIPVESVVKLGVADVGELPWRVAHEGKNSNLLNLAVTDVGDALEQEPNDTGRDGPATDRAGRSRGPDRQAWRRRPLRVDCEEGRTVGRRDRVAPVRIPLGRGVAALESARWTGRGERRHGRVDGVAVPRRCEARGPPSPPTAITWCGFAIFSEAGWGRFR